MVVFLSIDGRVCPFSMYVLYGMSHDRWIVWVGAATPLYRVPVGRCARRRRVAMTTIARARGGDAVVSIATSSRRRCRRWSVSTRARRGFLAEKLRDEGAGEDEGDARGSGAWSTAQFVLGEVGIVQAPPNCGAGLRHRGRCHRCGWQLSRFELANCREFWTSALLVALIVYHE